MPLKRTLPKQKKKQNRTLTRYGYFLRHASKTRMGKSYNPYGRKFLNQFKPVFLKGRNSTFLIDLKRSTATNPISIAIMFNEGKKQSSLFEASLRFSQKTISVEYLQGGSDLVKMREFDSIVSTPTSRYLIREICAQGKKLGYSTIQISNPKTQASYFEPNWATNLNGKEKMLMEKIMWNEASGEEIKQFQKMRDTKVKQIRERMEKLYDVVSTKEGFVLKGNYYVKNL
ncbi:MAG TPA: hypothetical protein PKK60_00615 [archaeon]|nr:hypothetical protein [archaeon]